MASSRPKPARQQGRPLRQPRCPPRAQPREIAEQALAAARQAGDRHKQAAALTDLGILTLNSGDAQRAAKSLQEALAIVQESGDRSREGDVLGNLGSANLASGDLRQAFDLFQQELSLARTASDPFAEKIALEHLGLVHARQQDFPTAIRFFDQALTLTRKLGDQRQEVTLLWHLAILHGELRQRDQAIAYAEASVALMRQKGKPEASWYADHLSKYRAGRDYEWPAGRDRGPKWLLRGEHLDDSTNPGNRTATQLPAHGSDGHQGDGQVRRLRRQEGNSRASSGPSPHLLHLRTPHRPALSALRLLHGHEVVAALRGLPAEEMATTAGRRIGQLHATVQIQRCKGSRMTVSVGLEIESLKKKHKAVRHRDRSHGLTRSLAETNILTG